MFSLQQKFQASLTQELQWRCGEKRLYVFT
jgi:hypothetical protein